MTLIPEGLVLLMSVTFAVAAMRLAKRNTLVQQMSATESLAAVDTICVDKTGTLTAGELRLAGVEYADGVDPASPARRRSAASPPAPATATRRWRRSPQSFPGEAGRVRGEVPFSSEWKWSGVSLDGGGDGATYVLGRPGHPRRVGRATPAAAASPRKLERRPRPAAGSSPSGRRARRCRTTPPPRARRG